MRELASVLLAFALLTGATIYAERHGDRQCLVSPPDRTAEEFVRELENKRWSCAREYLAEPAGWDLRKAAEVVGDPSEIHGTIREMRGDHAWVDLRLISNGRTQQLGLPLIYDHGWKISSH